MSLKFKNIISQFESCLKDMVENYSNIIAEKYNIDSKELEDIWNELNRDIKISILNNKEKISKDKDTKEKVTKDKDIDEKCSTSCVYVYTRGENKGEVCGSKTKDTNFCSKHKKFENQTVKPKQKVVEPTIKSKIVASPTLSSSSSEKISPIKELENKHKLIFTNHKELNKLWNKETGLFINNKTDKIIIGKIIDNVICPLSKNDIELCKVKSLKYKQDIKYDETDDSIENVIRMVKEQNFDNFEEEDFDDKEEDFE